MNKLDFIYARKSIRKFKDLPVLPQDLEAMLEAATYAPSPKHQQNWHFVVIENKELINQLANLVQAKHEEIAALAKDEKDYKRHMSVISYYTAFRNAPVVVVVYAKPYVMIEEKILRANNASEEVIELLKSPQSAAQAIGASVENFLLAATALGYGGCYLTGPTHAKKEIESLINVELPNHELMALISVGVPSDDEVKQLPRKPLSEVVTYIK